MTKDTEFLPENPSKPVKMASLLEVWPTAEEIVHADNPDIARVQDALLARNMPRAAEEILRVIYNGSTQAEWGKFVPEYVVRSLLGFIRGIDISGTKSINGQPLLTACVSFDTGIISISPIFFLRFLRDLRTFIWIMLHERNHKVLRVIYGSQYSAYNEDGAMTANYANFAEDAFIEADVRHVLRGPTGNDEVQLVCQREYRAAHGMPVLDTLDTQSRYTLLTSKWRTYDGPEKDRDYRDLLNQIELHGGGSVSYVDFVRAWVAAFPPDNNSSAGSGSLPFPHQSVILKKKKKGATPSGYNPSKVGGDGGEGRTQPLPLVDNPELAEALSKTLPLQHGWRSSMNVMAQHVRWSRTLSETLVSSVLAHANAEGFYAGVSLAPTLERSTLMSLAQGVIPSTYVQHYSSCEEDPHVLYVDVSGSMERYYGIVRLLSARLGQNCSVVKQFSTFVREVPHDVDCAYTSGGTCYDVVARDIIQNNYNNVIVLTDNTMCIGDLLMRTLVSRGINIQLIATDDQDYVVNGFNAIARGRVNLQEDK